MFKDHYVKWRENRIAKILKIFSENFFQNKTILELAAGHGHVGESFLKLGSRVTFAEGRQEHIKQLKEKFPESEIIHLNQDEVWNLDKKFDIVIHWGVLYHLNNWQQDLSSALAHANLIFLESEVSDSDDPAFDQKVSESGYDQAINQTGSRPSANFIEKIILEAGGKFTRYDDNELNSDFHSYDWKVENTKSWRSGLRRFWIIEK